MTIVELLAEIGIKATETIKGKIVAPDLPHVPTARRNELVPTIQKINAALQIAGILHQWRAKTGGTTDERWILIVAEKGRKP